MPSALGRNMAGQDLYELRGAADARLASLSGRIATPGSAVPTGPVEGQLWFETTTDILWVWIGSEWRRASMPAMSHFRWVATAGTTNSSAYVDFPGAINVAFTKRSAGTALVVHISGSSYADANQVTNIGVRINGLDLDVCYFFHNNAGRHDGFAATAVGFAGLAAGNYGALVRWKNSAGAGNIAVDGNDLFSLTVQEAVGT